MKPVAEIKNVWTDISGSINESGVLEYMIDYIGINRILFGSDMPGCSFLLNTGKVEDLDISNEDKIKIYYHNAIKWLEG